MSEIIIDYELITKPLEGENPCGFNIRTSESPFLEQYLKLKSIRSSLRKEERIKAETDGMAAYNYSGWHEVISIANGILVKYSKDIEIAVWLLEGLTRVEGMDGLKNSLNIIYLLLKDYDLKVLDPELSDSDNFDTIEDLLLPILMLNGRYEVGTIIAPLYFCPFIHTLDGQIYNGWAIKKILEGDNPNKLHPEVTKGLILESEIMKKIISDIDLEKFLQMEATLGAVIENFKNLNSLLTEKFERNAPNLSNIDGVLKYYQNVVVNLSKLLKTSEAVTTIDKSEQNTKISTASSLSLDNIDFSTINKNQALGLLEELIKFFRDKESHSPVAYLLARALSWSKAPLPEILCDLIPDDEQRAEYCRFSGVPFMSKGK